MATYGQEGSPLSQPGRLIPGSALSSLTGNTINVTSGAVLSIGGSPAPLPANITVSVAAHATGPNLTVNYSYVSGTDGGPAVSVRFQFQRSDGSLLPNGKYFFYDSGWQLANVPSANNGTYTINAVVAGIPTDTGSGSVDPSLHLVVVASVSEVANPTDPSQVVSASSTAFDIQWGVVSSSWNTTPAHLVSDGQVHASWHFSSTRGFPEGFWEATLTSVDGTTTYWDSGVQAGSPSALPSLSSLAGLGIIPYTLVNGNSYKLSVVLANSNEVTAAPLTALFVAGQVAPSGIATGSFIERFLALLAFQLDINRSLIEQLRYASDPKRCPGNLLPLLAQQLGVSYESEMGMAQTRKLLSTVVHQYKMKGTADGVEGISSAVTGWPAAVGVGANLSLGPTQVPQPSAAVPAGLGAGVNTGTVSVPVQPSSYAGTGWPTAWPVSTTIVPPNYAWWALSGQSAAVISLGWDSMQGKQPPVWGIPLQSSIYTTVSVGVYVWAAAFSAAPGITMTVYFWDQNGSLISSTATGTITATLGQWVAVRAINLKVPANTVWCSYVLNTAATINFSSGSGVLIVAAPQVEATPSLASYTPPREAVVALKADRTNLFSNPSFENGTPNGWTATQNCSIRAVTGVDFQVPGVPNPGKWSLQVTSVAPGSMAIQSDPMPVNSALLYMASIYVQALRTAQSVVLTLTGTGSSQTTGTQSLVSVYPAAGGGTTHAMNEVVGAWIRPFVQADPAHPLLAGITQLSLTVTWLNTASAGEVHYVDAALMEEGWGTQPQAYFDADIYSGYPQAADYLWTDANNKVGPSYYYRKYNAKLSRLGAVLSGLSNDAVLSQSSPLTVTGFLPLGTSYVLLTGAQAVPLLASSSISPR